MSIFRYKKPILPQTGGRAAMQSYERAVAAFNELKKRGYDENTVFYRPDNSPTMGDTVFAVKSMDDLKKTGLDVGKIAIRDAQDFAAVKDDVRSFKAGIGAGSTMVEAFKNKIVAFEGEPFYADPRKGLIEFQGIIKNQQSYDLGREATQVSELIRQTGEAPKIVKPNDKDLGIVFGPGGTQTPTARSQQLGITQPSGEFNYVRFGSSVLRVAKDSPLTKTAPKATAEEWQAQTAKPSYDPSGDPDFQSLPKEWQDIARLAAETISTGEEAAIEDFNKALTRAMELVDPYTKEQLRMAQDEVQRATGRTEADFASKSADISTRIKQIEEDLTYNREQISIEQAAELARQKQQYEDEFRATSERAVEAGFGFSPIRAEAERRLTTENRDIVESIQRQRARQMRDLQVGATRNVEALQTGQKEAERARTETLTDITRKGEETLGTAQLTTTGISPLGGITGAIPEARQKQVLDLQQILQNRQNPFTFNQ